MIGAVFFCMDVDDGKGLLKLPFVELGEGGKGARNNSLVESTLDEFMVNLVVQRVSAPKQGDLIDSFL